MDRYAKAIVGALIGALGAYGAATADGSGVTSGEWVAVAITFLGALGLVWAVPNAPTQPAVVDGRYLGDTTPTVRRGGSLAVVPGVAPPLAAPPDYRD